MAYFIKTPWLLKKAYPTLVWDMPASNDNALYLTFDDGPHPAITPFVLKQLEQYNAKATFFCIGNNVVNNPEVYKSIIDAGHTIANHTHNHLNGWKTKDKEYVDNIKQAAKHIQSNLFRPPYGRVTKFQARVLQSGANPFSIIMWNVLSGDFDIQLTPQKCLDNVIKNTHPGDIVVFHDSEKAYPRMGFALPRVLEYFSKLGYVFKAIKPAVIASK